MTTRDEQTVADRPLFICGLPRTGTSLLLSLFDGHPDLIVASHESKFFQSFLPRARGLTDEAKRDLAEEALFEVWRIGDYREKFLSHVPHEQVIESFRSRLEASSKREADYLSCSVLAYGEASGQIRPSSRYWVEKTPFTERHADFIFAHWSDARCIQMIRDPRDLACTYQDRDKYHGRPVTSLCSILHTWQQSARQCRCNRDRYGEDRYLEVRYEDLTVEPEAELARIREFMGVDDHETLRRPTRGAGRSGWQGNAVRKQFTGIDSSQVGRWRTVDPHAMRVVETLVGREMARHRYELLLEGSLAARVQALGCAMVNTLRPAVSAFRRKLRSDAA